MRSFFRNNGLSIAFLLLFIGAIAGQIICGIAEYNKNLLEIGGHRVTMMQYFTSGHFVESTFENWESEFLQMGLFVWMTIYLRQKGSSESKCFDKEEAVDREPSPRRKGAPWPVRKGGIWLTLYKHSLTIVLMLLFVISLWLHFCGSLADQNVENTLKGKPLETHLDYFTDSRFWFESFQNWQSEFLSVFAIIVLSIYLRQQGSSQSKPVDAPNDQTGES